MRAFETLLEEALQLSEDERGELASRLLRSLEPDEPHEGDELGAGEWEAAWATEVERRAQEVREGRVELLEGEAVMAEIRELVERP